MTRLRIILDAIRRLVGNRALRVPRGPRRSFYKLVWRLGSWLATHARERAPVPQRRAIRNVTDMRGGYVSQKLDLRTVAEHMARLTPHVTYWTYDLRLGVYHRPSQSAARTARQTLARETRETRDDMHMTRLYPESARALLAVIRTDASLDYWLDRQEHERTVKQIVDAWRTTRAVLGV